MATSKQVLTDFQALLAAIAGLVALVGSRIQAGQPPQGATLPTLTWNVIAAPTEYTHDGTQQDETVIQFDIDGRTPTQCREVADALSTGLSGKRITQGSTEFEAIFHDGVEIAGVAESVVEGTTQSHRLSIDYRLLHRPI